MIGLYLIAAHMVGDYVLANRWQAAAKASDPRVLVQHVLGYTVPFLPIAAVYAHGWHAAAFVALLMFLHGVTDTHRFRSSVGDWVAWKVMSPSRRADEEEREVIRDLHMLGTSVGGVRPSPEQAARLPVPPNPWAPLPILIDQTLHLCQLALLGGLLLR